MSKRSIKKRSRKPDAAKVTFKGLVAAGQEKAALKKLTKLVPQLAQSADDVMLEVSELSEPSTNVIEVAEDDTDHGEALHVHGDSCSHSE